MLASKKIPYKKITECKYIKLLIVVDGNIMNKGFSETQNMDNSSPQKRDTLGSGA